MKIERRSIFVVLISLYAIFLSALVFSWIYSRGADYVLEQFGLRAAHRSYNKRQLDRTSQFKSTPRKPGDIVFAGDSITQGAPWAEFMTPIKNRGVAGDTSDGLRDRWHDIIDYKPAKVIINIGTNDLFEDRSVSFIVKNIDYMIKTSKKESPGTDIFVVSVLPNNTDMDSSSLSKRKLRSIDDLNKRLSVNAPSEGYTYINAASVMSDTKGQLEFKFTSDGTHLNALGYRRYIEYIDRYVSYLK